jgi:two-component system sensor histidine kinase GlrK
MEPQTLGPVSLPDVVRRVMKEHKLAALARMIAFESRLAPAMMVGDVDKIRTIIDNLVSNAIKYSPRSGVIGVELSTNKGFAVVDVIDEGHGVDPHEREHIFDSFYQGKAPVEGRVKGSGLGLAIAREYALGHGGRIEVLDRADGRRGAQFRLWLPLAVAGEGAAAPQAAPGARGPAVTIGGGE